MNEKAVQANEQTDERVSQYLYLYSGPQWYGGLLAKGEEEELGVGFIMTG